MCAEHQPQQLGRAGRLGIQRVPPSSRGRCGWSSAYTAALRGGGGDSSPLYCNAANSSPAARIWPCRWQPSDHRRSAADACLLVPEGRRRKLAGGKPAPADAAPGCHAERAMPRRGIGEVFAVSHPAASPPSLVASGRSGSQRLASVPGHFFDAPLGHGAIRHRFRGAASAGADLPPQLISSGVPPGREPRGHALPMETTGAGIAFPTRLVAAPPPCVHRVSVVDPTGLAGIVTA